MADADTIITPAPRENPALIGHEAAEAVLAQAAQDGRLAHAWLITGPRGIGKATFAYRLARFVLAGVEPEAGLFGPTPASSLAIDPEHPVFRRIAASAHADLVTLERSADPKTKRLRTEIPVDAVRDLGRFLRLTPAEGGYRVAVVDSAEDLNRHAANALLKILEEPPDRALLLLVSHAPGRLLPTIRSRCRRLELRPLADDAVGDMTAAAVPDLDPSAAAAIARLAGGSPGRALDLAAQGGFDLYRELIGLLNTIPGLDVDALHALGDRLARRGAELRFTTAMELLTGWFARQIAAAARQGADEIVAGEAALAARLFAGPGLDRWVELWENTRHLAGRADRLNLDRKQVVISAFSAIERVARG